MLSKRTRKNEALALSGEPSCGLSFRHPELLGSNFKRGLHFTAIPRASIRFVRTTVAIEMNKAIQTLTIITVIFIPLSFIAGVYGMNFHYMPELEWRWGYPAVISLMTVVMVSMLVYFKRRRWLEF